MVNIFQYIVDYLKYAPTIIQLSWALSAVFTFTIISLTFYLKHLRSRLRTKERIQKVYEKKYEADLIEYLYSGNEEEEVSPEQQKIINYLKKSSEDSLKRKLIISTLLKLRSEISGETANDIQKLYYQTGLINYASSKLKHKKWNIIAKAIKELTQFGIKDVHDDVILLINHPKKEVRKEIQMYLVKLFHFEGLDFLNVLKTPLSEWDQIQLLEILQNFEDQKIPDINEWLESSNSTVVLFALKLAKIYNQFEAKDVIIKLLNHSEMQVRIEAIDVLSNMGVIEAVAILKNDFDQRDIEEQIAFFKMLESMYDTSDISFISQFINHENFYIKVSVMKILKVINVDNESNTFKIITTDKEFSESINLIKAS
ncbi:HEAT repeat domain-containing protein [Flavobacterium sp. WC2429]|uniref:HEAT repeat domain-containing protein n=1 Tax=Flavobacterium sp. WC2429 TaxID=3234140 RepID=A0AB39WGD3_9FLAO